jgi:hypothetical protein
LNFFLIRIVTVIVLIGFGGSKFCQAAEGDRFDRTIGAPMEFRLAGSGGNCPSCIWIVADGVIGTDTPDKFRAFLAKMGSDGTGSTNLHLNSSGGNLIGALRLGELIRSNRFNTAVSKTIGVEQASGYIQADPEPSPAGLCASACVFAFAGGVQRYGVGTTLAENIGYQRPGRIGVHQFYDPKIFDGLDKSQFTAMDRSSDQVIIGLVLEYLNRMGISSDLLVISSGVTPWGELHWLSDEELRKTGLDNVDLLDAALVAHPDGSASVNVEYSRAGADYSSKLYCDLAKNLLLSVSLKSRSKIDPESVREWRLFDEISLGDGTPLTKVKIDFLPMGGGGTEVSILFRFEGKRVTDFAGRSKFAFESSTSRYGTEAAWDLSFTLPSDFAGMKVLPRTCVRK